MPNKIYKKLENLGNISPKTKEIIDEIPSRVNISDWPLHIGIDFGKDTGICILDRYGNIKYINNIHMEIDEVNCFGYLINTLCDINTLLFIGYEKVSAHRGVYAAHAWGGYEAILKREIILHYNRYRHLTDWNWRLHPVEIFSIHVKTLKKYATGNGNASKEDMKIAFENLAKNIPVNLDITIKDDAIDAFWLAEALRNGTY